MCTERIFVLTCKTVYRGRPYVEHSQLWRSDDYGSSFKEVELEHGAKITYIYPFPTNYKKLIFTDVKAKKIYITDDELNSNTSYSVDVEPDIILPHPADDNKFLLYSITQRKLYVSLNFGVNVTLLGENVLPNFFWAEKDYDKHPDLVHMEIKGGSDYQISIFMVAYARVLSPALQGLAIVSNIVTMATFCTLGLKDSMNVTLWPCRCRTSPTSFWTPSTPPACSSRYRRCSATCRSACTPLTGCVISYQYIFLTRPPAWRPTWPSRGAAALPCRSSLSKRSGPNSTSKCHHRRCVRVQPRFQDPCSRPNGLSWQKNAATNLTRLISTLQHGRLRPVQKDRANRRQNRLPGHFLVIAVVCCVILTSALIEASKRRKEMTFSNANQANKLPW
ncbi:VPS10 domain-containing receptor SorCS3 [Bulinus truncatus]|nr:VPS10 domain-containing receptor SorCS3 [Bulinus truncatus]